jgi:hypothetical protein
MGTRTQESQLLRSLEEDLLRPEVRRSADLVGRLLADDFLEIGSSGCVSDKTQTIHALQHEAPDPEVRIAIADFTARHLAPGLVLVNYRAVHTGTGVPESYKWRSSIWQLLEGRWQMVFHQGTPGSG